jgi:hypothetical protein
MKCVLPLVLASLTLSAVAVAQPRYAGPAGRPGYYGQPSQTVPGGFWDRGGGLVWGVSLGVGGMSSEDGPIECPSCTYSPLAWSVELHLGGMLSPQLALLGEFQGNVQTVEEVGGGEGTKSLAQVAAMVAAQYWITPQLWVKGGLGVSHLEFNYDDYYQTIEEPIDDGGVVLLGIGYEILSGRDFAVDLQGRYIVGSYDGIDDKISSGTVGLGVNWY